MHNVVVHDSDVTVVCLTLIFESRHKGHCKLRATTHFGVYKIGMVCRQSVRDEPAHVRNDIVRCARA